MNHATSRLTLLLFLPLLGACEIQLGRPELLWLLWTIPLILLFNLFVFRAKGQALRKFAQVETLKRIASSVNLPRQKLKAGLLTGGIFFLLVSLAQPKWGFHWEEVQREGVDIVIALDVSDSMLVEDAEAGGKLTRLERAKREITDLFGLLQGDRLSLVAFAGMAFVECPLTLDYAAADLFLSAMDTDIIPVKGTALGEALRVSLKALENSHEDSRAILLITDGEDHSGQAMAYAEKARDMGVKIFTIGIGRDEGAPIPSPDGGFRRNRQGEMILSKLDETTLQKIALTTGGRYVRSVTGDMDLEEIYLQGIKATLETQELGSRRRQHWEHRFQWALLFALLLLMGEPFISERTPRPQGELP